MTKFRALQVEGWRQFGSVRVDFHPRATIITGANGAGKTTLLSILSQHFGWSPAFAGTLRIDARGARKYYSGFSFFSNEGRNTVGQLTYDDGSIATLQAPTEGQKEHHSMLRFRVQARCRASTLHRIDPSTAIKP